MLDIGNTDPISPEATPCSTGTNRHVPFVTFEPVYVPANEEAKHLVQQLVESLGLEKPGRKSREKILCVLASFVRAARIAHEKNQPIGWLRSNGAWSEYPFVGHKIVREVREALEKYPLLYMEQKGGIEWKAGLDWKPEGERWITLYRIDPSLFENNRNIKEAQFADTHRVYVQVARRENWVEKRKRKETGRPSPKLSSKECRNLFKAGWRREQDRIKELQQKWVESPLVGPEGQVWVSATRIFNDESLNSGGRFYGGWTNLKKVERVKSTIGGELVCEIDVNASQPCLLMSMLGDRISDGPVYDLYENILSSPPNLDNNNKEITRKLVKKVVTELIGTGNPAKIHPSDDLAKELDDDQWIELRDAILEALPALLKMKAHGITGSGYLAYHESEIIRETMLELKDNDITSYPMHDCLIVAETHKETAADILQEVFARYCQRNGGLGYRPALTLTDNLGEEIPIRKGNY